MKRQILPVIATVILIAAVGVFLYPTVSEWINMIYSESEISHYNDTVDTLTEKDKSELISEAERYNRNLNQNVSDNFSSSSFDIDDEYLHILNITDNGQIATIDIPSIDCSLPIYHSGGEDMLTKGAVHLAGTALPIGGASTHSIISAHTAYPGKILFDRLTEIEVGDEFSITVLGDTLYYRCVEINVVLPSDTSQLGIEKGRDLVTLVTCTPYSVNTHRLLVTGERIENSFASNRMNNRMEETHRTNHYKDVIWVSLLTVSGALVVIILIIIWRKRRRYET